MNIGKVWVSAMIRVEEARERILEAVQPLGLETVNLLDALHRVAGEEIRADRAIPPWDHSAMDGYALRADDTAGASADHPVRLAVIETIPAGSRPAKRIGPGQAARIMTGAPIPAGADAVVRREDTAEEKGIVAVCVAAIKGQKIRRTGSDVPLGEEILSHGDLIRPAGIGLLASQGRSCISVHRRPLVAVVATGSELVEVDEELLPGKIVASNSYELAALVRDCGAIPLRIGIAGDRREELMEKFREATQADLMVSAGGVSVGDYDLVKGILQEEGNRLLFWQVAMSPGKQLAFGRVGKVPIVGLPGTPSAAMVCFEQFVRPAILRMSGHANLYRRTIQARLAGGIEKKGGFRHFIRARVSRDPDGSLVVTTGEQGPGAIKTIILANAMIVLPEGHAVVAAGEMVTVQILDDSLDRCIEPGH